MKIDRLLMRKLGRKLLIQKAYFVINVRPSLWMITYENWPIVYEKKWTKNSDTQSIFVINVSLRFWTKSYDKNLNDCLWQNSDENFWYRNCIYVIIVRPDFWTITYENWPIAYEKIRTKTSDTESIFCHKCSSKSLNDNLWKLTDSLWEKMDEKFWYTKYICHKC